MNYEKKYKEALAHAREIHRNEEEKRRDMEFIFPELAESEDERIKEALIQLVKCNERSGYLVLNNVSTGSMIAWLEKQGEPTEINPSEFDLRLNKLLKQFESLPKEELITNLSYYLNVIQNDGTYKIEKQGKESIIIDADPNASYDNVMISDIKNNKKQDEKPQRMISAEAKEALYNKPTWSEEEVKINRIVACLENLNVADNDILLKDVDWLKSLKDRIQPQQKQEWSKEDEAHINGIIDYLFDYKLLVYEEDMNVASGVQKELDWLQSLKGRIGG